MTTIVSPLVEQDTVELSQSKGLYKKQILPRGKFSYEGETIDFDAIAQEAVDAFSAGAMDQVAFQLADDKNRHNWDPKNYRGDVKAVELADDGVYATIDFSNYPDMQELVTKNPKFGVSATIERNIKRGDGQQFGHAFSQVLGTLNPKVNGMKPWEAVTLSNADDEVIDLTDMEVKSAVTKPDVKDEGITLSKEEYDQFTHFLKTLNEVEDNDVNLSNEEEEENPAIKLANERAETALRSARQSEIKLAKSEWERNSAALVRDGVPPKMLELAKSLMERPDSDVKPIQLSKSESLDPKSIVLSVLEEAKGTIDLSEGKGHQYDGSEDGEANDPAWTAFRDDFFQNQF
jgi:hypothetical protein